MPKYRGYYKIITYKEFEFEGDDEELAVDHGEYLINANPVRWFESLEDSGPTEVILDDVVEV